MTTPADPQPPFDPDAEPDAAIHLTAYALGELDPDGPEFAAVQSLLADPGPAGREAAAALESIRAMAGDLTTALAAEPLSQTTKPSISSAVSPTAPNPIPIRHWPRRLALAASLAAAAALGIAVLWPDLDAAVEENVLSNLERELVGDIKDDQWLAANDPKAFSWKHETKPADLATPQPPAPTSARRDTRDLLAQTPSFTNAPKFDLAESLSNANSGGGGGNAAHGLFGDDEAYAIAATPGGRPRMLNEQVLNPRATNMGIISLGERALALESAAKATPEEVPKLITLAQLLLNIETYDRVTDNPFLAAIDNPLSTFSIDVDTASYANVRRMLDAGTLPPADAVRIEELVNYFDYGYAAPNDPHAWNWIPQDQQPFVDQPFAAHVQVTESPWSPGHRLVRIGLKGKEIATDDRPAANLVFLLDVSGSMNQPNKLPLVKAGMKKLVQALRMDDRVAIVVYAGASGLVLDSTSDHDAVLAAIDNLSPGGSTHGSAGIELAYEQATQHHIPGGLNRVILCTDGDFNVGITDRGTLTRLIETKANLPETPTYLTVLGFGTGNLKDAMMEELSNVGDGNYGYIDNAAEAEKLLAEQVNATLLTIAKDVKIQVEFNPARVESYRLIGYENRLLATEDFNNDVVDAGDIGAGHTVTALYEVVPASADPQNEIAEPQAGSPGVDPLKYQQPAQLAAAAASDELLTLKLRYKAPDAAKTQGTSRLIEFPVMDAAVAFDDADDAAQFAAAVAGFGMLLRGSPYAGDLTWEALDRWVQQHVAAGLPREPGDLDAEQQRRQEFAQLVHRARALAEAAAPRRGGAENGH